MGKKISFLGLDGEVLAAEGGVPLELGSDVSEVGKLNGFAYLGVDHNCPETYSVLHEFHLDAVGGSVDV